MRAFQNSLNEKIILQNRTPAHQNFSRHPGAYQKNFERTPLKLISEYLTERLHSDYAGSVIAWDKIKTAAAAGGEGRPTEGKRFVPSEAPPTYKEPREAIAMVLAYREQIKFLDRLKLIAKATKGLGPDTTLAKALVTALTEGGRALKALEEEQEPVIAAGMGARKASEEAHTAAFKAWERRMESERAHWQTQQS